jgi:hypothetical protein
MEIDFNITVSLEKISALMECMEDALINATSETGLTTEMKKLSSIFYITLEEYKKMKSVLEAVEWASVSGRRDNDR